MKRILLTILATASLTAGSAFAQFEGQIDMKITAQGGVTGTGKVFVSRAGSRTEMDMETARMPIHMTTLMKFATPDVMYLIHDEARTSKDLLGLSYESMKGLMRRGAQDEGSMMKALKDARAEGFFVKMVTREKGKTEPLTTMELTKAEKKSLPASMFEVPTGYAKQEGMMGAAMENLTPEQKKQMEEMMKQRQHR